jgi:eukaryotic-like serine/threonine-protein kinase
MKMESGGGPRSRVCRLGRFEILDELGRGGMATVYLARVRGAGQFERKVALKLLRRELAASEKYRAMFCEEARIQAEIRHQYVCAVHDFGEIEEHLFLEMEYLEGERLDRLMAPRAFVDPGRERVDAWILAKIFGLIAEGLHAVHAHGGDDTSIVHRDMSPQNLFVLRDGSVRITDFGIARDLKRPAPPNAGLLEGKIAYVAPEQLEGVPPTRAMDYWGLGVSMWELLVGRPLFLGDNTRETLDAVRAMPIEPPSSMRSGIPECLDDLVLALLDRDPRTRLADGLELSRRISLLLLESQKLISAADIGHWLERMRSIQEWMYPSDQNSIKTAPAVPQKLDRLLRGPGLRS